MVGAPNRAKGKPDRKGESAPSLTLVLSFAPYVPPPIRESNYRSSPKKNKQITSIRRVLASPVFTVENESDSYDLEDYVRCFETAL